MALLNESPRWQYLRDHSQQQSFLFSWAVWWYEHNRYEKAAYLSSVYILIVGFSFFIGLPFIGTFCFAVVSLFWGVLERLGVDIYNSIKPAEELDVENQAAFNLEKNEINNNLNEYNNWHGTKTSEELSSTANILIETVVDNQKKLIEKNKVFLEKEKKVTDKVVTDIKKMQRDAVDITKDNLSDVKVIQQRANELDLEHEEWLRTLNTGTTDASGSGSVDDDSEYSSNSFSAMDIS